MPKDNNLKYAFNDISSFHEKITRKHLLKYFLYRDLIKKFLILFNPEPNDKIIDLACGNGYYGKLCSERGGKVLFLDINFLMLKNIFKHNEVSCSLQNCLIEGDIRRLPFKNCSFDKTLCFGAFPPLPTNKDIEKAIIEFIRITKPGGVVFFTYNPPHFMRFLSIFYLRFISKFFLKSLRVLPFIDGSTSGVHSHELVNSILKKINKPYIRESAGMGVFGIIKIKV